MLKDHQDILWLAGQVLLSRSFVKEAEEQGLEAIFKQCPYGDLTESEKETFAAAFKRSELREALALWWKHYDAAREAEDIPGVRNYWE